MRYLFIFYLLFLSVLGLSQDISFSQAYVTGTYLNPALTGLFNGSVRVSTQYREQGRGGLDNVFKTYVISSDIKYNFRAFNKFSKDVLGVGIFFINDRVELYDFNTNMIALSLSYHKALGFRTKQYLGIGFQFGVLQKNINREHLTFEDMFDKVGAYSFPTAEPVFSNNFAVGDFSLGMYYTISPGRKLKIATGIAYQHFASPNISFYRKSENIENTNKLFHKITYHASMDIKSQSFLTWQPRVRFVAQGPYYDMEAGTNLKMTSFNWDVVALHFGLSGHVIKDLQSVNVGAIVPFFGLQYNNFLIGFSYDVVMTHVINSRRNLHAFEFSLSYLGDQNDTGLVCPKF